MQQHAYKTALVAINAQYIHTGLGVRSLAAYVRRETDAAVEVLELTINTPQQEILAALYRSEANVYLFSCYIWNIELTLRVARNLRRLLPDAQIGLGGPQVSYQGPKMLDSEPEIDFIVTGEGEATVCELLGLLRNGISLGACRGLVIREGGHPVATPARPLLPMDALPFAYPDLNTLQHRIFYYESMRGCPFACSYCSSSIERGVRKRSLPLVFADLAVFLEHRVPQVKFVDRTFNCDKTHALSVWKWLATHDNGVTNFHFELSGELLDEEMLRFLAGVRPQLFQFEIGVQSTNPSTLREIDRPANLTVLFNRVKRLLEPGNIHVHLDLIAGLPYEGYERFQASFNDVFACKPHQLQLGFLKVLPGSKMERMAQAYGLLYTANAPYEVLETHWIRYPEILALQGVASMVQVYYNSFRYPHILQHLVALFPDAFTFFQALSKHYEQVSDGRPLSDMAYYALLESFVRSQGLEVTEKMRWLTKFDLLLHEKPHKLPEWIAVDESSAYREAIQRFFMNAENIAAYLPEYAQETSLRAERTAHLEVFPFHPENGAAGKVAVVFNYRRRDVTGAACFHVIPIEALL